MAVHISSLQIAAKKFQDFLLEDKNFGTSARARFESVIAPQCPVAAVGRPPRRTPIKVLTDFDEVCASERKIPHSLTGEALALGAALAWVNIFRCMGLALLSR